MIRDVSDLQGGCFDVVIVGGGITGACLAADAALRGMSVALVEKGDFGSATSSASSKLLHGGIRYLQQGRLRKVRESASERTYFQTLAPHLTRYVPFVVPTYRGLQKSKAVMKTAMIAYEFLCVGQNQHIPDPVKKVPSGRTITRNEIRDMIPGFNADDLTGGILFYESHMHSSERMTLAFLDTATRHGAAMCNYAQVDAFLGEETKVTGVRVKDCLTGGDFELRASLVVNAAGPWIPNLNRAIGQCSGTEIVTAYSKGAHIVTRALTQDVAVAFPTKRRSDAMMTRGGRHVFIIPWRGHSLVGTTYSAYDGDLDEVAPTEEDVVELLSDVNSALGGQVLRRENVVYSYAGLYPLIDDDINSQVYQGTGDYQIADHAKQDGVQGLVSVFGAKYTTARLLAEKALNLIVAKFDKPFRGCQTRSVALAVGNISSLTEYCRNKELQYASLLSADVIRYLVTNYGTAVDDVVALVEAEPSLGERLSLDREEIAAEAIYAATREMAVHLEDFVLRRTGLGTLGNPGREVLQRCANLMGDALGWNEAKRESEVAATLLKFVA